MTDLHPGPPPPRRVSWPLVTGLGSLALLWPLTELTGVAGAVGRPAAVLLNVVFVAAVWVGCVGVGRVSRPVLTLTLAGTTYGLVLTVVGSVLELHPEGRGLAHALVAAAVEMVRCTVLGALAGGLALTVQRARDRR